jgi:XTP/dITP diphosphohydrolase/tetrapyrrole methylase family protein/MazG family protein/ATP diphosphatase
VPHTVEEAYELGRRRDPRDDGKLLDELGDVLFQVHFLSLLLEERGAATSVRSPSTAARSSSAATRTSSARPTPETAGRSCRTGTRSRRPSPAARPASSARSPRTSRTAVRPQGPAPCGLDRLRLRPRAARGDRGEVEELRAAAEAQDRDATFHEVGDVLFAAVNVARKLKVDPELALRAAADRFRGRVESAAALAGDGWDELPADQKLLYYAQARMNEA